MGEQLPYCDPPPAGKRGPRYEIVRCNEKQRFHVEFWSLSDRVKGFDIHYVSRRSIICTKLWGECEWCDENTNVRWVGYLCGTDARKTSRFLVELTPGVMDDFKRYRSQHGTLRGHVFRLLRPSKIATGPLVMEAGHYSQVFPAGECPAPFDLDMAIKKIYRVPNDFGVSSPEPTHADAVTAFVNRTSEPLAAADPPPVQLDLQEVERRLEKYSTNGKH